MEQTGDPDHDRYQRVSHGGTFNANPYAAATGNAALRLVATGELQDQADRMAAKLRIGLQEIMDRHEIEAAVYGDSSTFHVYFGASSVAGLDANVLKNQPVETQNAFRQALQVRGVDLMSRTSGVLSGTHTDADIDQSLEAFDGAVQAMVEERPGKPRVAGGARRNAALGSQRVSNQSLLALKLDCWENRQDPKPTTPVLRTCPGPRSGIEIHAPRSDMRGLDRGAFSSSTGNWRGKYDDFQDSVALTADRIGHGTIC